MKKYCATCGEELKESYLMCLDNFLQVKYFEELDGSDNMFCDTVCACKALMIEDVENEDYGKEDEDEEISTEVTDE